LSALAKGRIKIQAFGITEPHAGSDTGKIKTFALKKNGSYIITGQKIFISRTEQSDYMLLLARTIPTEATPKKTKELSIFLVDLRKHLGKEIIAKRIDLMFNHHTYQVFIEGFTIDEEYLIGDEGMGFYHLLDGVDAERILIASECIGDGIWFLDSASQYAKEGIVFDRPIGSNQGIAFPLARAYVEIKAAALMRDRAAEKFDNNEKCGAEANVAKLLAPEASWIAANAAFQTFGGFAFAKGQSLERKFRETRLYQIAPVSTNLILAYIAEHELKLPRSY